MIPMKQWIDRAAELTHVSPKTIRWRVDTGRIHVPRHRINRKIVYALVPPSIAAAPPVPATTSGYIPIPMKQWANEAAELAHVTPKAIWRRLRSGTLRVPRHYINRRVVYALASPSLVMATTELRRAGK